MYKNDNEDKRYFPQRLPLRFTNYFELVRAAIC